MADENTTGSDQVTTEGTPPANEGDQTASTDTSNTPPNPTQEADGDDDSTLLTPKQDGEGDDEPPANEDPAAEFHGAPEGDYEMIALPEGMTVDTDALAAFTPLAKEIGLSQAGFAKVVEAYANTIMPGVQDRVVDNLQKDIAAQHAAWATEAKEMVQTDKETFGDAKLDEVLAVSAKAIDRFGGEDFREFLRTTGLGNHPAMVKMSYLVGTLISEDTAFERGGTASAPKSRAEKFYGPQS